MRGPGWFQRKALSREQIAATEAIRGWIRASLPLPDGTTIAVNEIVCTDPSCPGTETVMLIMAPGHKTRAAKVDRELVEVTQAQVREALGKLPA
jgi:hypothetical protein